MTKTVDFYDGFNAPSKGLKIEVSYKVARVAIRAAL